METQKLLFELCHETRYSILKELSENPQRLTRLAEAVGANNPEVSRHLDRMKATGLVEKDPEGAYSLSLAGDTVLRVLPSKTFIAHNVEFFEEHDLSRVPPKFISRLGELEKCEFREGAFNNMQLSLRIYNEARERLFLVYSEVPSHPTEFIPEDILKEMD